MPAPDAGRMGRRDSVAHPNERANPAASDSGGAIGGREVKTDASQSRDINTQESKEYHTKASQTQHSFNLQSPPRQQIPKQGPRTGSTTKFLAEPTPALTRLEQGSSVSPVLEPPVTKATLSELDVNKIVHNPKLRHDINFDPDLHFRPNLDGEKGRRKTKKADHFWETMRTQLRDFLTNREEFEKQQKGLEWCLPSTLNAIRGILETLVPHRDRSSVEETFNVDLLMQQFTKGVADLEKLALWLSQLLKCHCAPMRDDWVDEMVYQLSTGERESNVALLVEGMRTLLGVLEAMKLVGDIDYANYNVTNFIYRMWPITKFDASVRYLLKTQSTMSKNSS